MKRDNKVLTESESTQKVIDALSKMQNEIGENTMCCKNIERELAEAKAFDWDGLATCEFVVRCRTEEAADDTIILSSGS